MPRGFGRGWGSFGWFGHPFWGWGRGNPFPFCRNFPWLPRWWWATPYAGYYAGTIPYLGYGYPFGMSSMYGYGTFGYGPGYPVAMSPSSEAPKK